MWIHIGCTYSTSCQPLSIYYKGLSCCHRIHSNHNFQDFDPSLPTFLLSGVSPFATVPGGKKSKEIIILLIIIIIDALIVIDVDFAGGSFEKFSRAWTSTADKHAKVSKLSATHPHNCHAPLRSPLQCIAVHQEKPRELTWDAEGCLEKGPQGKSNSFTIVGNGFSQCIDFWYIH